MSMEALEGRALMANVSAVYNLATFDLTITAPDINDKFAIKENSAAAGGQVTVSSLGGGTVINGFGFSSTTLGPVRTIEVNVTGPNGTADVITLTGAGKSVPTTVVNTTFTIGQGSTPSATFSTGVNLAVNNVDNSGTFSLTTNGQLALTVDNSTFASLNVDEDSTCPCPATVELGNDTINGSVTVALGAANGDSILLQNGDRFGSTFLAEGDGNADSITVKNSQVKDLDMEQGNGNSDKIVVDTVKVSLASFGVFASQGNGGPTFSGNTQVGAGDLISINAVTVLGTTPPLNTSTLANLPGIVTIQGNGNQATTNVTNSIVPGEISESQGNGNGDTAQVLGSTAGFVYTPINLGTVANPTTTHSPIIINQGNGNNDVARVANSTAYGDVRVNQNPPASAYGNGNNDLVEILSDIIGFIGATGNINSGDGLFVNLGNGNTDVMRVLDTVVAGNIELTEGNGNSDQVVLLGTHAGSTVGFGPGGVLDVNGNVEIEQGDGSADTVTVGSTMASGNTVINNLEINQGLSLGGVPCCTPIPGDTVNINDATVTSDITVRQGILNSADEANDPTAVGGAGSNTVNIATTSPVSAGGVTTITQGGANNVVVLGGAGSTTGPDFITTFLDVNTGAGGNGYVTAANTTVVVGSFAGNDFIIDGGGDGNVFQDLGGGTNSGVSISGNYFGY